MAKKDYSPTSIMTWLNNFINLITNHGIWKMFWAIVLLSFAISSITIAVNPEIVIDRIEKHIDEQKQKNREFRATNNPIIREELTKVVYELDALRSSVFEFHNGKSNPSSLGFWYADMTYEMSNPTMNAKVIYQQYQNINLSLLNLSTVLNENGYWYGSTEDLKKIDPMLAGIIETNDTKWISFILLEGTDQLGIMEISFSEIPDDDKIKEVGRIIRKSSVKISSLLDYKAHLNKN